HGLFATPLKLSVILIDWLCLYRFWFFGFFLIWLCRFFLIRSYRFLAIRLCRFFLAVWSAFTVLLGFFCLDIFFQLSASILILRLCSLRLVPRKCPCMLSLYFLDCFCDDTDQEVFLLAAFPCDCGFQP